MALTANGLLEQILASRQAGAKGFDGISFPAMARGVAMGIASWGRLSPANLGLTGSASGPTGTGAVVPGTTRIVAKPRTSVVLSALRGAQLNGQLWTSLGITMALGVSLAFTLDAQYIGLSPTVATGPDVSTITTVNPASLISILNGTLTGALGTGVLISRLSQGLGLGLSTMLLGAQGVGTVTGVPVPPGFTAAGITTSTVV